MVSRSFFSMGWHFPAKERGFFSGSGKGERHARAARAYRIKKNRIGNVEYSMPKGTQPGTVFRLRGKGIPSVNGSQTSWGVLPAPS